MPRLTDAETSCYSPAAAPAYERRSTSRRRGRGPQRGCRVGVRATAAADRYDRWALQRNGKRCSCCAKPVRYNSDQLDRRPAARRSLSDMTADAADRTIDDVFRLMFGRNPTPAELEEQRAAWHADGRQRMFDRLLSS